MSSITATRAANTPASAFGNRCTEMGVRPSMGSVGDAYDNAMAESFFATLACELIDPRSFKTKSEARWRCSHRSKAGTTRAVATRRSSHRSPANFESTTTITESVSSSPAPEHGLPTVGVCVASEPPRLFRRAPGLSQAAIGN